MNVNGVLKDHYQHPCPYCQEIGDDDECADAENGSLCGLCGEGEQPGFRWWSWYADEHVECDDCGEVKDCAIVNDTDNGDPLGVCFDCWVWTHAKHCNCGRWAKWEKADGEALARGSK